MAPSWLIALLGNGFVSGSTIQSHSPICLQWRIARRSFFWYRFFGYDIGLRLWRNRRGRFPGINQVITIGVELFEGIAWAKEFSPRNVTVIIPVVLAGVSPETQS